MEIRGDLCTLSVMPHRICGEENSLHHFLAELLSLVLLHSRWSMWWRCFTVNHQPLMEASRYVELQAFLTFQSVPFLKLVNP